MKEFKTLKEAAEAYEKLELENETLKKSAESVKTLETENKAYKKENNEQAAKIAELESSNSSKEAEIERLKESLDETTTVIGEYGQKIEHLNGLLSDVRKSNTVAGKPTFEHKGKTYEINGKSFGFEGQIITPEDIQRNPKLQEVLLEMEVGFITEVPEYDEE